MRAVENRVMRTIGFCAVAKVSVGEPAVIISEVAPGFPDRDPAYCLVSEERNLVRRNPTENFNILYIWGPA